MTNNKLDENEWRYEIKFIINKEQENLLYSWIAENKTVFRSYPNRSINSIYYDDFDNKSMVDNLSGISSRIKYRIRWYDNHNKIIKTQFEMKIRNGRLSKKNVYSLNYKGNNPVEIDGNQLQELLFKHDVKNSSFLDMPILNSVIMVKYEREYFESGRNLRITLDSNLDFFEIKNKKHLLLESEFDYPKVLEFKFPLIEKENVSYMMRNLPFTAKRNSKYLLGASKVGMALYL